MAVTVTAGVNTPLWKTFAVIATADADTAATINHGFGVAPLAVFLMAADPVARLSLWVLTSVSTTQIVVGKATTAGSGGANPQLIVTAFRNAPRVL